VAEETKALIIGCTDIDYLRIFRLFNRDFLNNPVDTEDLFRLLGSKKGMLVDKGDGKFEIVHAEDLTKMVNCINPNPNSEKWPDSSSSWLLSAKEGDKVLYEIENTISEYVVTSLDSYVEKNSKNYTFTKIVRPNPDSALKKDSIFICPHVLIPNNGFHNYYFESKLKLDKDNIQIVGIEEFKNLPPIVCFFTKVTKVAVYANPKELFIINSEFKVRTRSSAPMVYHNLKYKPYLEVNENNEYWYPVETRIETLLGYLREQIRARYGFFPRPKSGLRNVIIDSYFPRLVYKYGFDFNTAKIEESLPTTSLAISKLVAELMNVRQVETEELCRVLGYTKNGIKKLLKTVKDKELKIVFVGAGGTGINTAYWLSELCSMTHTFNLFETALVFEKEFIEVSNMLRFPMGLGAYSQHGEYGRPFKLNLINPLLKKFCRNVLNERMYLTNDRYAAILAPNFFDINNKGKVVTKPKVILYGAPGIEYRNQFSEMGRFVCATHADLSCSIWLNPKQDNDIQIESYGMIQLGSFFMNQLRMAIGLLELLASNQDLNAQDTPWLDYSFDGTIKLRTERVYNWQIDTNLRMLTEQQAMEQG